MPVDASFPFQVLHAHSLLVPLYYYRTLCMLLKLKVRYILKNKRDTRH